MALPFDPIELVATAPERNVHRRWSIRACHDLFGALVIETCWGRAGTPGTSLTRSFPDEESAERYVRRLLSRRSTATRRLGCAYSSCAASGENRTSE